MPRPNKPLIAWNEVPRLLLRRRREGLRAFTLLFSLTLLTTFLRSPRYESQVFLERKPVRVTPVVGKQDDEQFDVYRLTSESQWSVALLKSRFILEKWLEALGRHPQSPGEKEQEMNRLARSLTVQPVSYTDLFIVKVRALSPEEANRRARVLVDVFSQWDLDQNRQQAQAMVNLLQERQQQVNQQLSAQWARLKAQKASQSLSLSGSSATRQLELDLNAKEKLYDMLTTELEEAERQLHTDQLPRTHPLAPPSLPGDPVLSRFQMAFLGFCLSVLAAFGFVIFREWQHPLRRPEPERIYEIPSSAVYR